MTIRRRRPHESARQRRDGGDHADPRGSDRARQDAGVPAGPAQAVGRSADGQRQLRHRARDDRPHRRGGRRSGSPGGPGCDRHRRRQHLSRCRAGRRGDGPRNGRLHGHARDADERARAAGRVAARRRRIAGAVGAADRPGRRAVHPRPRVAPSRGAQGRHLRGRHRQPVLHDRHGRGAARPRDGRRHRAEGDEGRRRVHVRPAQGRPRRAGIRR